MSQENVEISRALYDEFGEGRFWTCDYLFDPDVEYERRRKTADVMTGKWRGLEAMGAAVREERRAEPAQVRPATDRSVFTTYMTDSTKKMLPTRARTWSSSSGVRFESGPAMPSATFSRQPCSPACPTRVAVAIVSLPP
jgi:hypothetical protein